MDVRQLVGVVGQGVKGQVFLPGSLIVGDDGGQRGLSDGDFTGVHVFFNGKFQDSPHQVIRNVLGGDKVAQAVDDIPLPGPVAGGHRFDGLEDVRMGPQDDIRPPVKHLLGQLLLGVHHLMAVLNPPMDRNHHHIRRLSGSLYLPFYGFDVLGVDDFIVNRVGQLQPVGVLGKGH